MRTNPNFTEEELLYIEKLMDLNSSFIDKDLRKDIEGFMIIGVLQNKDDLDLTRKLLMKQIQELDGAYSITKSIRDKIEELRK
jgi:hypothetical protein